jgi:hypothetical protein
MDMKRFWRELLFWAFVSLFFILAPILLLTTAGYRYQFGSSRFIQTGVLSISAIPRSTDIAVNGKSIGENTPYVLQQLTTADYHIGLSRDGYHSWEGDVTIHEGESSFLNNIMLFLDGVPELITQELIQAIATHPQDELIAFSTDTGAVTQIWLQDLSTGDVELVREQALDVQLQLSWSLEGSYLLINSDEHTLYTKDLEEIEIDDAGDWEFDPERDHILYQIIDGSTIELNLDTENLTSVDLTLITSPFSQPTLELVDNGDNVEIRNVDGADHELVAVLPHGNYTILEEDAPYILLSKNGTHLILLDLDTSQIQQLETPATIWDWNPSTHELVYSDGHEVNTYEVSNGHTEFVTRQSDSIISLHWLPEGEHIILTTDHTISAVEQFAQAQQRFTVQLVEQSIITQLWLSDDGNDLYYLVEDDSTGLMRLELRK